jgi:uncharacterized coiled-coil protein SlyX
MSIDRRSLTSNAARIAAGVLALALLVALLATVFLSRGSIDDAEAQAQTRAVDWANTVLFDALAPEQVAEPILGPDYRELLITVQAGILSDDRAARVRIWNTDGALIFSDDQRDEIGGFVAQDNPQIEAALAGDTVSVPTDTSVAPKSGLAGSDERLFQTFVPLRLVNQLGVSGVVQIDQRYSAVEAAASDVWQTVRLSLVIALTLAVVLFLFTLRARPAEVKSGEDAAAEPSRQDRKALERMAKTQDELRATVTRAEAAEAVAAEAEATVGQGVTRLRELEDRAAMAEERAASAEASLQEAVQRATGGEAPKRGVPGVGAVAAGAAAPVLEARLQTAEGDRERAVKAERRATEAETRIAALEAKLGEAEDASAAATAADAKREAKGKEEQKAAAELRAAQLELNDLKMKLVEAEAGLPDAQGKLAAHGTSSSDLEQAQHARTTKELEVARAALSKGDAELAAARWALTASEKGSVDVKAVEERATAAEARATEAETKLAEAQAALVQAEKRATDTTAEATEAATKLETTTTQATEFETKLSDAKKQAAEAATRAADAEAKLAEAEERATAADAKLAEAEKRATAVEAKLKEVEEIGEALATELETLHAERAKLTTAAGERAAAPGADASEFQARIAELEEARRNDVAELHRAQEALANTQFEATQAQRHARDLEDRVKKLQAAPAPEPAPAVEVPDYVTEQGEGTSFSSRLASLVHEHESGAPAESGEPPPAAGDEEVLSLRERLARAAAARHRAPGAPGSEQK